MGTQPLEFRGSVKYANGHLKASVLENVIAEHVAASKLQGRQRFSDL